MELDDQPRCISCDQPRPNGVRWNSVLDHHDQFIGWLCPECLMLATYEAELAL
jgi:hypothetical protein